MLMRLSAPEVSAKHGARRRRRCVDPSPEGHERRTATHISAYGGHAAVCVLRPDERRVWLGITDLDVALPTARLSPRFEQLHHRAKALAKKRVRFCDPDGKRPRMPRGAEDGQAAQIGTRALDHGGDLSAHALYLVAR